MSERSVHTMNERIAEYQAQMERIPEYQALRRRCAALKWPDTAEAVFAPEELARLDEVYDFANSAQKGQLRLSGEPYITHPIAVAQLLLDIGMYDFDCLTAALLHDVAEDTKFGSKDIAARFGATAGQMVEGLTKLSRMEFASPELAQAQT